MDRKLIDLSFEDFPMQLHSFVKDAKIYDSSCSELARVYYIDKGSGYYLKRSPKESLKSEAHMTGYFAFKGLSCNVIEYLSEEYDWMLTEKISGEDCTFQQYLDNPERLCDTLAILLRKLHETEYKGCPIEDHTNLYFKRAEENYSNGIFDSSFISDELDFANADDAWRFVETSKDALKNDALLHGDYCLPNVILDNWNFSGFIDLGNGGVGDPHVDIFWAIWTLEYNLKTDKYKDRFIDAYGRSSVDKEKLKLISVIEAFG